MPEGFIPSAAGVVGVKFPVLWHRRGGAAAEEDCGNDNKKYFHALLF